MAIGFEFTPSQLASGVPYMGISWTPPFSIAYQLLIERFNMLTGRYETVQGGNWTSYGAGVSAILFDFACPIGTTSDVVQYQATYRFSGVNTDNTLIGITSALQADGVWLHDPLNPDNYLHGGRKLETQADVLIGGDSTSLTQASFTQAADSVVPLGAVQAVVSAGPMSMAQQVNLKLSMFVGGAQSRLFKFLHSTSLMVVRGLTQVPFLSKSACLSYGSPSMTIQNPQGGTWRIIVVTLASNEVRLPTGGTVTGNQPISWASIGRMLQKVGVSTYGQITSKIGAVAQWSSWLQQLISVSGGPD
jgi:hypothetical protein